MREKYIELLKVIDDIRELIKKYHPQNLWNKEAARRILNIFYVSRSIVNYSIENNVFLVEEIEEIRDHLYPKQKISVFLDYYFNMKDNLEETKKANMLWSEYKKELNKIIREIISS